MLYFTLRTSDSPYAVHRFCFLLQAIHCSPFIAHIESVSLYEVKVVDATINSGFTPNAANKLIGDKAYDSDERDQHNFEMVAPHRKGRKKPKTQYRRKLRSYRRLWKA